MRGVLYDSRWIGNHGIGRFAAEVGKRLGRTIPFQRKRRPWHPLDPILLSAELRNRKGYLFFSPGYNSPLIWPGKFMFTLHDLNHLCVPENSNALKRAYYRHVIRPACHKATFVLTVSEYSRREIAGWARIDESKIINVSNGVGEPFGPTGHRHDPGFPYLLYVGSRKPHKNLPRLLEAYSLSGIASQIRMIVSGMPDKEILTCIRRYSLDGRVSFLELQSTKELAEVYRGATGFLFPSLYEGFGLPPLEAMACGVPVLTSKVCSLPEVVGDAAVLVNPYDVDSIADGMRTLAFDSEARKLLRERGLQRARTFTWEETARRAKAAAYIAMGRKAPASDRGLHTFDKKRERHLHNSAKPSATL